MKQTIFNPLSGKFDTISKDILSYTGLASFPAVGQKDTLYVALDTNLIYLWDNINNIYVSPNSGGAQDLQQVTDTGNVTSNVIKTGVVGITYSELNFGSVKNYAVSLGKSSLLDVDKIRFVNVNNGLNILAPTLTQNSNQTFQDASGTIALLSDIPNITLNTNILYVASSAPIINNSQSRSTAVGRPDKPFQSLQSALNVSLSSDKIVFLSDITENVVVATDNSISLIGNGNNYTGSITVSGGANHTFRFSQFDILKNSILYQSTTSVFLNVNYFNCNSVGALATNNSIIQGNGNTITNFNLLFKNINIIGNNATISSGGMRGFVRGFGSITGLTSNVYFENIGYVVLNQPTSVGTDLFVGCNNVNFCSKSVTFKSNSNATFNSRITITGLTLSYIIDTVFEGSITMSFTNMNTNTILRNVAIRSVTTQTALFINSDVTGSSLLVDSCLFTTGALPLVLGSSQTTNVVLVNNKFNAAYASYSLFAGHSISLTEVGSVSIPLFNGGVNPTMPYFA